MKNTTSPSLHLFAFLGTGNYQPCSYLYPAEQMPLYGPALSSPPVTYVQTAIALGLDAQRLERVTIFVTAKARAQHGEGLLQEFQTHHLPAPIYVDIPDRLEQSNLHELFDVVQAELIDGPPGLVFDLTHGLRALPALGLLIMNYVRSLREEIEVESIVYGAWELRDEEGKTPLVDLISLWELNEWASGFDAFERTGNMGPLVALGRRTDKGYWAAMSSPEEKQNAARPALKSFLKVIEQWHHAMQHTAIPLLIGDLNGGREGHTNALYKMLREQDWNPITQHLGRFIRPLRERLASKLEKLVTPAAWSSMDGLRAQLELIKWYKVHGQYAAALTVSREWLTSYIHLATALESRDEADRVAGFIAHGSYTTYRKTGKLPASIRLNEAQLSALEQLHAMLDTASADIDALVKLRNQINHGYMPSDAKPFEQKSVSPPDELLQKVIDNYLIFLENLE